MSKDKRAAKQNAAAEQKRTGAVEAVVQIVEEETEPFSHLDRVEICEEIISRLRVIADAEREDARRKGES